MPNEPREQSATAPGDAPAVLIVDDDPASLRALAASLDGLGARIVCAPSGQDALSSVLRDTFAVVLLDLNLPDIDGFDVARMIRERQQSRHADHPRDGARQRPRDDARRP